MLTNYLKLMRRGFLKNKLFSIINLFGLTIGITCFILIAIYVQNEMNYDRYNKNTGRIVLLQQFENTPVSGGRLAGDMKQYFSSVEKTVRLKQVSPLITHRENSFYESNFYFADITVLDVFTFTLVSGNKALALKENDGVIISEKIAQKYFPNQDPVGKEIIYDHKYKFHVTGVLKNLPANSHLQIDFLASYVSANKLTGWDVTDNYWAGSTLTYLLLSPGTNPKSIEAGFPLYLKKLNDPNAAFVWKMHLIPLRDIYLNTSFIKSKPIKQVYIFSIAGIFILALACFNYINLATARSSSRAKEVGVRKVMGSSVVQLQVQFILETVFFVMLAVAAALIIIKAGLPWFNTFSGKSLSLSSLFTFYGLIVLLSGIVIISLFAGGYPAFILSSYKAAIVLKGEAVHGKGKAWLRKTLVVAQFSVSMIMMVATIIVFNQLEYIRNKDLGYQRSQILTLDLHDAPEQNKLLFKQQLTKLNQVYAATIAYGLPGSNMLQGQKLISNCVPQGAKDASISMLTIDEDFLKTFNIRLLEGRLFDKTRINDKKTFLINESAKKYFGWKDIKDKQTGYYTFINKPDGSYEEMPQRGEVIGVIADYNHTDLKAPVQPMIIALNQGWESQIAIKINPGNISTAVSQIQALWSQNFSAIPFSYQFMDDTFNKTYQSEMKTGKLLGLFAILAIFISCLGLLGLVAYAAEWRKKEIGIRKVLGASVVQIIHLLSKDFIFLIGAACVIAFPVAWYAMQNWLQDFAYRINISGWVFVLVSLAAVLIALFTISFQAIKAAVANPVKSLRTE
jgi:putative ABC transport system permease protein